MAYLGGLVLIVLTALTCISIIGRSLLTLAHMPFVKEQMAWFSNFLISANVGPVPGDFELVEAGIAFAVFAFLPWCQVNGGHASVDIFTSRLSMRMNRLIDLVNALLMAVVFVLVAWRLWVAASDKLRYGETTFILQFPVWWSYAFSVCAALVVALTAVWVVWIRMKEMIENRNILAGAKGQMR